LRVRYDEARHPELGDARRRGPRSGSWSPRDAASTRRTPRPPRPPRAPRPTDPARVLADFLGRVERLTDDELDRLSLAESPPIAFSASIARFLSPERAAA